MYSQADSSVTISVPPVEAPDSLIESAASETAVVKKSAPAGYRLRVEPVLYRDGERVSSRPAVLGFAQEADAGFGTSDHAQPPAVGPHVRVSALPEAGPGLARSLKPLRGEGAVWTLHLDLAVDESQHSSQEVTLRLTEQGRRPDDFRRYVIDQDRGRRVAVSNNTATLELTPDQPSRRLRVIVGTESFADQQRGDVPLRIEETKLRANAPNPFRRSTTVFYQLASEQNVTLRVYDVLGRKVATLVNQKQPSGVHHVTWRAAEGEPVSSGVYFLRMQSRSYTGTRKVTVVR